jgi:hypothetical protein
MRYFVILLIMIANCAGAASISTPFINPNLPPEDAKVLLHFNGNLTNLITGRDWYTEFGIQKTLEADAAKYGSGGLRYQWDHSLVTSLSAPASDVADIASIGTGSWMVQTWFRVEEITEATEANAHGVMRMYFYKNANDYLNYTISAQMIIGDYTHYNLLIDASTYPFGGVSQHTELNLNVGDWHHIAFVRDNGTLYLYLDGILVDSDTNAAATYDLTGLTRVYDYSHTTTSGILAKTNLDDLFITTDIETTGFTPPSELGAPVSPKLSLGYHRNALPIKNSNGVPTTMFVVPMELNGGSTIDTVGNFNGTAIYYRDNNAVKATEDAKLFNRYGLKLEKNLSYDSMLLFTNAASYINSNTFTVGWWMRVDEIGSITTTTSDGFNIHLRNANGVYNMRVGLVYTFPDPLATGTLNLKMGVRYAYSLYGLYDGYDTATQTVNVGEWHHFAVTKCTIGAHTYMFFYMDGNRIDYITDRVATSGTMEFAQHLWMGWFGFTTPIENYSTVKVSVDEFFYSPSQLWNTVSFTPPGARTLTEYGKLQYRSE